MVSVLCLLCTTPEHETQAEPTSNVCFRCRNRLLRHLNTVEDAVMRLDHIIGENARRAPGFGSQAPARVDVLAACDYRSTPHVEGDGEIDTALRSILGTLHALTRVIADERDRVWPNAITVTTECRYLRAHLDWITAEDWIDEFAEDLSDLALMVRRLSGEPGRKRIGNCTNLVDGGECGTPLYAPLEGDMIQCTGCRRRWYREEWLRLGVLQSA